MAATLSPLNTSGFLQYVVATILEEHGQVLLHHVGRNGHTPVHGKFVGDEKKLVNLAIKCSDLRRYHAEMSEDDARGLLGCFPGDLLPGR